MSINNATPEEWDKAHAAVSAEVKKSKEIASEAIREMICECTRKSKSE